MSFGTTVDKSLPYTVIEAHHPVDLWVPRHAHLAKGTYMFQGDLRPYFRDTATRRLVTAGVVSVQFIAENTPAVTVSARTEMVPEAVVVSPKAMDLKAQIPADFAPAHAEPVTPAPVLAPPSVGTAAPQEALVESTPAPAIYATEPEPVATETAPVVTEPEVIPTESEAVVTNPNPFPTEEPEVPQSEPEPVAAEPVADPNGGRRRRRN